jgi:hypothetical protein
MHLASQEMMTANNQLTSISLNPVLSSQLSDESFCPVFFLGELRTLSSVVEGVGKGGVTSLKHFLLLVLSVKLFCSSLYTIFDLGIFILHDTNLHMTDNINTRKKYDENFNT